MVAAVSPHVKLRRVDSLVPPPASKRSRKGPLSISHTRTADPRLPAKRSEEEATACGGGCCGCKDDDDDDDDAPSVPLLLPVLLSTGPKASEVMPAPATAWFSRQRGVWGAAALKMATP
jgi:hypothetical protein